MTLNLDNIPAELKALAQWVPWKYVTKPGVTKPAKVPKLWNRRGDAKTNDPGTWTTFESAYASYRARQYDGIGFVFAENGVYTGIDLDNCIGDDGRISPEAQAIISNFNTYSEVSPSGKGVKLIVRGTLPGKGKKVDGVEMYCRGRFFTITGNRVPETSPDIREHQAAIDQLYATLTKQKPPEARPQQTRGAAAAKEQFDPDTYDQETLAERCWSYLKKCPDAISGDGGHGRTFRAACECYRFGLDDEHAAAVMRRFNAQKTGDEPWTEGELQHKLHDARREVEEAGETGTRLVASIVDRKDPLPIARRYVRELHGHAEHRTLIFVNGDFYRFNGACWQLIQPEAVRHRLYNFLEPFSVVKARGEKLLILPFKPMPRDVDNVVDALRANTFRDVQSPAWLVGADGAPAPTELIVARNGLFDARAGKLQQISPPTPRLFVTHALDYDLLRNAPRARQWLAFLHEIFDGDEQQIELLQEWFGYCMTPDTSLHKILMLIGPMRSGKGTIARVLRRMLGDANVCGPTLASLATNFGLWPLIGKLVAIISDARLSGRSDQVVVTERLLTISGEDTITIDRKNQAPVTLKLPTRITLCTNELPRLADASGAIASRFEILHLRKSYLDREDTDLTERLYREVAGIAAWSIEGLMRLREERRFTRPASADSLRADLRELGSPVSAFVRECCRVEPGACISAKDLFDAWCFWCRQQGRHDHGTKQTFGRDLHAAQPGIKVRSPRHGDDRVRTYEGITLTLAAEEMLASERSRLEEIDDRRRGRRQEVPAL